MGKYILLKNAESASGIVQGVVVYHFTHDIVAAFLIANVALAVTALWAIAKSLSEETE